MSRITGKKTHPNALASQKKMLLDRRLVMLPKAPVTKVGWSLYALSSHVKLADAMITVSQILRRERGQGNIFPVQLTTCRIGNLTRLIHTFAICVTIRQSVLCEF